MRDIITYPTISEKEYREYVDRTHEPEQAPEDRALIKAIADMGLPLSTGTLDLPESQRRLITPIPRDDDQKQVAGWNLYGWDTLIDDWQVIACLRVVAYPDYPNMVASRLGTSYPHADITVYDVHSLPGDIVCTYLWWLEDHGVYPPEMQHRTDVTTADLARYQRTGRL